jgi:glycosyltransferase involved in cell wall biosynthesis
VNVVQLVIGGDVAGGQIVALQIAHAARDAGHRVSFVSPTPGPFVERVRREGFVVEIVPISGALDVRAVARLTRSFRGQRADLVHTHGHFGVNVAGRVAARLAGAAVISHMHIENAFRPGAGRGVQVRLDNATARLCAAIVAVSDATRASLERQGYPQAKLQTIHNGIEEPAPVDPVELAPRPTILEVARLAEVKGQRTLVRALARLDAHAVLVGRDLEHGGAFERELRDEAARLGVAERVVFAGPRDDVPSLLAGCDVFCLPSTAEGLPIVVLEAMAAGRPVVASAVGGTPELVGDGVTGLLVPPADPERLAEALGSLLADPARARALGEAGRERVRREFSLQRSTARVLDLYTLVSTMRA